MTRILLRFAGRVGFLTAALTAAAQRPPYQPAPQAGQPQAVVPAAALPAAPQQVYVDERCRILPDPATAASPNKPAVSAKKPKTRWNPAVCHLENVFHTRHRHDAYVGNELERSNVEIYEQQYVLQNVTPQAEIFIIQQPALKGWTIEGDPPPYRVAGGTAYYRAWVQPGQVVQLHVGMRKVTELKPRILKASAPPASPGGPPSPSAPPSVP